MASEGAKERKAQGDIEFPSPVVFKGDNGKYLKVYNFRGNDYFVQFSGEKYEEFCKFEVKKEPSNGYYSIKSLWNGCYWNGYPGGWIRCSSSDFDESHCYFKVILVRDGQVALQYVGTNKFCTRLTDYWKDCLNACDDNIRPETTLTVEEPVVNRTIEVIEYDKVNAVRSEVQEFSIKQDVLENNSDYAADLTSNYTHTFTKTTNWSSTTGLSLGMKVDISAGVPFFAEMKVEISGTVTQSIQFGGTTTTSKALSGSVSVKNVAPGRKVMIDVLATSFILEVPYTYRQIDRWSDGTDHIKVLSNGIFKGAQEIQTSFRTTNID